MFTLALIPPVRRQGLLDPYRLQHADELLMTLAEETAIFSKQQRSFPTAAYAPVEYRNPTLVFVL